MGKVAIIHSNIHVYIYGEDHLPKHIHIYYPRAKNSECSAKIRIDTDEPELIENKGFSEKDLKRIGDWVEKNLEMLLDEWRKRNEDQ